MSEQYSVKAIGFTHFLAKVAIVVLVFLIPIFPGYHAQNGTSIISIIHKQVKAEDVFTIVADGPLSRPFFGSGNRTLEMEFQDVSCAMPAGTTGVFATHVSGVLADRLFVQIQRKPFASILSIRLRDDRNFSYYFTSPSSRIFELHITPGTVTRVNSRPPAATPGFMDQFTLEVQPGIERIEEVRESKKRKVETCIISKVEYLAEGDSSDSLVFTFTGITSSPSITVHENPLRLKIMFPGCRVKLPGSSGNGPYRIDIPGKLMSELVARNVESRGEWSAKFEFSLIDSIDASVSRDTENSKLITIHISPGAGNVPSDPGMSPEGSEIEPEEDPIKPDIPRIKSYRKNARVTPFAIGIPEIILELDWPADREKILKELDRVTADMFPGTSATVPIRLKLRILPTDEEPAPMVFKGDTGNIRKFIK